MILGKNGTVLKMAQVKMAQVIIWHR